MRLARAAIIAGLLLLLAFEGLARWRPQRRVDVDASAIRTDSGRAFVVDLPAAARWLIYLDPADHGDSNSSTLELFENGAALGPAHASHQEIRERGGGRFSFWGADRPELYFSTSDGSDPRSNGRSYESRTRLSIDPLARSILRWTAVALSLAGFVAALVLSVRRDGRPVFKPALSAVLICAAGWIAAWLTRGVPAVAGAAVGAVGAAWIVGWCLGAIAGRSKESPRSLAANLALTIASLGLVAVLAEITLFAAARFGSGSAGGANGAGGAPAFADDVARDFPIDRAAVTRALARAEALSPESEWSEQALDALPDGARRGYLYYGHPHCFGEFGERIPKEEPRGAIEGLPTVLVIGDSLTWGQGVSIDDRWSAVLRRERESERPIRIVNLAACGYQSEDSRRALERGLAESAAPAALLYGVCHNDLLPSGAPQESTAWRLPSSWRARSRLASTLDTPLVGAQLRLGLAHDFYADAVRGGSAWGDRFEADAARMVELARGAGAEPVAMVLDAFPRLEGSGRAITLDLEKRLARAGFSVIASEPYYRRFDKVALPVSRWEGHPNEIAHAVWGRMFADHVAARGPASLRRAATGAPAGAPTDAPTEGPATVAPSAPPAPPATDPTATPSAPSAPSAPITRPSGDGSSAP